MPRGKAENSIKLILRK